MKKVVIFCQADWAGSAYQVVKAINSVGRIKATQVVCQKNKQGFEAGISLDGVGTKIRVNDCPEYEEACQALNDADLVHTWNNEIHDFYGQYMITRAFNGNFPAYNHKYKSCTMTGTWYRIHYPHINQRLQFSGNKLVVQDATFQMNGVPSTFIPHAIDIDMFKPVPIDEREEKTIGVYHKSDTTANKDIIQLQEILNDHPGWRTTCEDQVDHSERLKQVSKCMFFFQHMSPHMMGMGRSTLEALALGIPVFNSVAPVLYSYMPDLPVMNATPETLADVFSSALLRNYKIQAESARKFVEDYHSYQVIGEQYTKFFEELI